jgi:mRNA interferase HigB
MRIHLIRKETILSYCRKSPQRRIPFAAWLSTAKYADWGAPADILAVFPGADLLGNGSGRVVFNIGGNNYRMICKYAFGQQQVHLFICWIGTHAQYDQLCRNGQQYSVNDF